MTDNEHTPMRGEIWQREQEDDAFELALAKLEAHDDA